MDAELEDFLIGINCQDAIDKMNEEKIDKAVIPSMEDESLARYIKKEGDRIAVRQFCQTKRKTSADRKISLIGSLRRKLDLDTDVKPKKIKHLDGNSNAKKTSRKIELGWLHEGKQVRTKNGGGTRKVDVDKTSTRVELLQKAKHLFFTGKKSKIGMIDELEFQMCDFSEEPWESNETVGEIYQRTGISLLRFFLSTNFKHSAENTSPSDLLKEDPSESPDLSTIDSLFDFLNDDILHYKDEDVSFNYPSAETEKKSIPETTTSTITNSSAPTERSGDVPIDVTVLAGSSYVLATSGRQVDTGRGADLPLLQRRIRLRSTPASATVSSATVSSATVSSDSDDTNLPSIEPSPNEQNWDDIINRDGTTLQQVLSYWIQRTLKDGETPQEILIQRERVLPSALRVMKRQTFQFDGEFKVTFSGEIGDDQGGPKREFLTLLMSAVADDVLEGPEDGKLFKHDIVKLENKTFETAGKLVAFSILHGGQGLPCLNERLYQVMIEDKEIAFIVNDITDVETKDRISQIQSSSTQSEYDAVILEQSDWLIEQGISATTVYKSFDAKNNLVRTLTKNYIYYRTYAEITQFIEGMNCVSSLFGDIIKKAPSLTKDLLVSCQDKLTFRGFRELYAINYSQEGSNRRQRENSVVYCLEAFLKDCEDGVVNISLNSVLAFWTGASKVPPLGFQKKLEVAFIASDEKQLPVAHTCGMVLELWRGYHDPDEFSHDMDIAIHWGRCFYLG